MHSIIQFAERKLTKVENDRLNKEVVKAMSLMGNPLHIFDSGPFEIDTNSAPGFDLCWEKTARSLLTKAYEKEYNRRVSEMVAVRSSLCTIGDYSRTERKIFHIF